MDLALGRAEIILVLIKDDEIESFIKENRWLKTKTVIHCSGSLVTKHAQGFHPHYNFTDRLYSQEKYESIPFIIEKGSNSFQELFPDLPNPSFEIKKNQRALYHALSVMSGNFPTILWQAANQIYTKKLKLPENFFVPYIQNCVDQFMEDPENALTGPLVRNDKKTIQKNITALKGTSLDAIYKTFAKLFPKIKR